jgi:hypothetical protein
VGAQAWPDDVAPPPYAANIDGQDQSFYSAFCPACQAQVIGLDALELANDLLAHVALSHL